MNPEDGYIAYIVNPKSGAGSGKAMVKDFKDYLCDRGFDVRTNLTKSLPHARELASAASRDGGCGLVVVAGGDGTAREAAYGLEHSDKPLLIIPCGTENLLANELGFNERTKTLIKAFEGGEVRWLDIGCANGLGFTCIASFGFDGDVVKRVNDMRTGHINHLDYFWPIWRTFWGHKFPNFKVVVDGEEIFDGPGLVFVGNTSRYAVGIHILRHADYGDGLLDVCIYRCSSKLRLVKHSIMTILKRHSKKSDVVYKQGKCIEISSTTAGVNSEIDGDPGPGLPIRIEVVPRAVKVLVPPGAKPAGMRTRLIRALG